jgi:hypothetical protein
MSIEPSVWQPLEEREWEANRFLVAAYRTVGGPIRVSIECGKLEDQLPSMSVAEARKLVATLSRAIEWADKRGAK